MLNFSKILNSRRDVSHRHTLPEDSGEDNEKRISAVEKEEKQNLMNALDELDRAIADLNRTLNNWDRGKLH